MGRHQWAQDVGFDCRNQTFQEDMSGEMVDKGRKGSFVRDNFPFGARIARYFLFMTGEPSCNKGFYHKLHRLSNPVRRLFAEGS